MSENSTKIKLKCILTSYLDLYDKDENGNKIAKNFGNENYILDNIKSM